MPSSASATSSSNRSADTSTRGTLPSDPGPLTLPSCRVLTHCPQGDGGHAHPIHSVSTGVSTSYPEMSKVAESLLTVVLRIGKVTPPDAQCTARRKASSTPKGERPARGNREPQGFRCLRVGWCNGCAGRVTSKAFVHRRVGPRKWAGTAARGRPERRSAARGEGSDETWNGVRPRGVRTASARRLLGAEPRFAQARAPPPLTFAAVFHSPWGQ